MENINSAVDAVYRSGSGKKRKWGEYVHYSPEVKAKIARYAIDNGPTKAAKHFSKVLEKNISESTVRGFKSSYILQSAGKERVNKLTTKSRGRPTLLPNVGLSVKISRCRHLQIIIVN